MPLSLPRLLRECRERLETLPRAVGSPAAARARNLLIRDLLPRTLGNSPYLVAGIIGPANSGKSALFNHLVGRDISPSRAEGGLTKSLFGVANPKLVEVLQREPELRRFPITTVDDGQAALEFPNSPDELLLSSVNDSPPGLLLIDTPDFDSVVEENRLASESLLAVADLVVLVVTRHTYQNRDVVHFLRRWLDCGRPWVLLYNEASGDEDDKSNVRKLVQDIGSPPLGCFSAPYQKGNPFAESPATMFTSDTDQVHDIDHGLRTSLFYGLSSPLGQRQIKSRALHAAVSLVRGDLEEIAAELASRCAHVEELEAEAVKLVRDSARRCAGTAMPLAPLLSALATSARNNTCDATFAGLKDWWLRARSSLGQIYLTLRRQLSPKHLPLKTTSGDVANSELVSAWGSLWIMLSNSLGRKAESSVRESTDVHFAELLDADLASENRSPSLERAQRQLEHTLEESWAEFGRECQTIATKLLNQSESTDLAQYSQKLSVLQPKSSSLFVARGLEGRIAAPEPEAENALLVHLAHQLLDTKAVSQAMEAWIDICGRRLATKLTRSALPTSTREWHKTIRQEGACVTQLREYSSEIGAALAVFGVSAIEDPEIPITTHG